MFGRCGPYGVCCTGRLMQWRVWVQSVVFESQTVASCIFLHNHGFVSYPLPACRSVRKKPHHIRSACCRHHLPAELYQIFRKSISRLSLTLAACPSCCLLERAVSAPLHERREQAQLGGEQEEVSEVSGLALLSRSPHFSYPSAAWWISPALPCGASVRAAACQPAQTAGSGESLAACVASSASPRRPLYLLGSTPASLGTPCCHPALVMSPDVPLGLGCSSSGFVFSVAVEGEGDAIACGPWARSLSPRGAQGTWGAQEVVQS